MAVINNYTTLVQAVKDEMEDDSTEFADFIPTALAISEDLLFKELDMPDLEIKATDNLVTGTSTLTKPTGYEYANYIYIIVNSNKRFLKKRREDYLIDYWPNTATTDVPKYYSDSSETQFLLAPTPDSTYAYEIKYTKKPVKLSISNLTNYYTTDCVDILFYATLSQMALFNKASDQAQTFGGAYSLLRDTWNRNVPRTRRDAGTVPNNPEGTPNSLKHTDRTNA